MNLPEDDVAFLASLGLTWSVTPENEQAGFLEIENFDVSGGGFTPTSTTLMIRIPALYNTTPLDMWFCNPPITRNGQFPSQADVMETYLGRAWQRFSRHFPSGSWRPGVDGIRSLFRFIEQELQGKV